MNKYMFHRALMYLGTIILIAYLIIYFLGCSKNPIDAAVENVKLIANFHPMSTVVTGKIVDAATGELISSRDAQVTILSANSSDIIDLSGKEKSDFISESGFLAFGLKKNILFSENTPYNLRVMVHVDGYISSGTNINVTSEAGCQFILRMVNIDNPPEGVVVVRSEAGETDLNGITQYEKVIETPGELETQTYAKVRIPESIKILDKNGLPLQGSLNAVVAYFSNQSSSALQSFPGGFDANIRNSITGELEDGTFISGGFVAVEIFDQSGRQAKTFNKTTQNLAKMNSTQDGENAAIEFSVQVPGETINPETNSPVKENDTIGIWSYDLSSGEWQDEGVDTLKGADDNGNYTVTFPVEHLSYWNLDWKGLRCEKSGTIKFISNKPNVRLLVRMVRRIGGGFIREVYVTPAIDPVLGFLNAPANLPVTLYIYAPCNILVGVVEIDDLCSFGYREVEVTVPSNPNAPDGEKELRCQFTAVCNDTIAGIATEIRPTMPVWVKRENECENGSYWDFLDLMQDGKIKLTLAVPETYCFAAVYNGKYKEVTIDVREDNSLFVYEKQKVYKSYLKDGLLTFDVIDEPEICNEL